MEPIRGRATEIWSQLAVWQRFVGLGLILTAIGFVTVMSLWMREPAYRVLYRDLSERDASAMINVLETSGIPYRLSATGSMIEVAENQVAKARLDLAAQNLPQGGSMGYELFDTGALNSLGMTEFMQRVNFQRALEGELTRTITAVDGVEMARVHIVIPEESLFVAQQSPTKASVILRIRPGARIDSSQIQSIRFLVANSVDGLTPANISIMDVAGNLYDMPDARGELSSALATNGQLEVQRLWELESQNDLQAMLERTLGPGKAVVRVSVQMNWNQEESQVELYAPAGEVGSVIRSSSREEERYTGAPQGAMGVPGVDPNAPVDVPVYQVGAGGDGEYSRSRDTINYEVSREVRSLVKQPGSIERISVAVILDEGLPPEQVDRVQDLIEAAMGINPERGDQVRVQQIPFNDNFYAEEMARMQAAEQRDFYLRIGLILAALLGLGLVLFFIRRIFNDMQRRMIPFVVDDSQPALAPVEANETQKMLENLKKQSAATKYNRSGRGYSNQDDLMEGYDYDSFAQLPPPDESELRLRAIARHNPDVVANILEDWAIQERPAGAR